jgi:3-dehydroquinate synthase
MRKFDVDLGGAEYSVQIADNVFSKLDYYLSQTKPVGDLVFIIDAFINEKYISKNAFIRKQAGNFFYVLPGKKNNKSFYTALKVFEFLEANNISRDATIIAIGGGVVGDLAAFIASCWYRGTDLVHIPTTLLSAVDSCLGGKTAINFRNTVNAVGSYYHPKAIFIDTKILSELPAREISSGFGEIIKYGMIGNDQIKNILHDENFKLSNSLDELIELSLKEKEKFVKGDIKESSNRLYLNFGHTIGHAIEFSTIFNGEETLRHGEGVGLGMLAIFRIAIELGYLSENDLERLKALLSKFMLPTSFSANSLGLPREALVDKVVKLSFKDKKRIKSHLRMILLDGVGNPFVYKSSDTELIAKGVREVIL